MKSWILTIGIDKFRLTDKEAQFYRKAVDNGAKYAQIGNKLLGTQFQSLVIEKELEGKWECKYGRWHNREASCLCKENLEIKQKLLEN